MRYLGIQVGYHILPEANFDKMLSALKGKLISWSTCRLSLAGRILVVNQVLLASMWYMAASWDPNPRMCSQVRGVVRNFIWSGKSTNARAKVKWETLCRNPTLAKCGGEAQHLEKLGFGVLRDSRMFRAQQQDPKQIALGCS